MSGEGYTVWRYTWRRRRIAEGVVGRTPQTLAAAVLPLLDPMAWETERLWAIALDTKLRVVAVEEVAAGAPDGAHARVADILRLPVRMAAVHVAFAHNHPSGDPTPSPADRQLWASVQAGARLLDLTPVDAFVIGDGAVWSLRDDGLCYWFG